MGPVTAITTCLKKPFTFSGRATRSEFWWFWLAHVLVPITAVMLAVFAAPPLNDTIAIGLFYAGIALYMATIPTTYCSVVRRFHDTGRTGKYSAFFVVAVAIIVLVLYLLIGFAANSLTGTALANPGPILYILPSLILVDALTFWILFIFVLAPLSVAALIIFIILAVMLAGPSQSDTNKFGPNPNEVPS